MSTLSFKARTVKGRLLWTVQAGREIVPVGYCAMRCAGHATAEEAAAHYTHFLAEVRTQWVRLTDQAGCLTCGQWTDRWAVLGVDAFPLCEAHATPAHLLPHLRVEAHDEHYEATLEAIAVHQRCIREATLPLLAACAAAGAEDDPGAAAGGAGADADGNLPFTADRGKGSTGRGEGPGEAGGPVGDDRALLSF